jgi:hypothetical protein
VTDAQVAILGGGIVGCISACLLTDLGYEVVIVEQAEHVMDGASRWNDGKIHLGYTFTGRDTFETAELLQEGAAAFAPVLESVIGSAMAEAWFGGAVTYVVDRDSIYDAETLWHRTQVVAGMLERSRERSPRLQAVMTDGPMLERVTTAEAMRVTGRDTNMAGWRTTERHVSTRAIAASIRRALAERDVPVVRGRVTTVGKAGERWRVTLDDARTVTADAVLNALWQDRAVIDHEVAPDDRSNAGINIRFKYCLFGTNADLGPIGSSTRILGPFGDIATYGTGEAYLSWYPTALVARSDSITPPIVPAADREAIVAGTLAGLGLPKSILETPGAEWRVRGGYVVAYGRGDVGDPATLLHTRHRAGIREPRPGYVSVDTGKYTLGPLFAARAVEAVRRRVTSRARPSRTRLAIG